jgi:hypothetical protein
MGIVTIRCPATGKEVPTGVVMEPDVFERASFGPRAFVCELAASRTSGRSRRRQSTSTARP